MRGFTVSTSISYFTVIFLPRFVHTSITNYTAIFLVNEIKNAYATHAFDEKIKQSRGAREINNVAPRCWKIEFTREFDAKRQLLGETG